MASTKLFMVLVIAAIFVPSISAVDYVVGDDKGWTINFDYQSWALDKVFYVGDKLVFKYPEGAHNVLKVNGTGFQQCEAPDGTVALTSGNDEIILATPGRKWYICGVARHCEVGNQKLFIDVLPQWTFPFPPLTPAPSPSEVPTYPAATTGGAGSYHNWNGPVSALPIPSPEPSSWFPFPFWAPISPPSASPEPSSWFPFPFWAPIPAPSASPAARAAGSRTTHSRISR